MAWTSAAAAAERPPCAGGGAGRLALLGIAVLPLLLGGCGTIRRLNYGPHHTYMPLAVDVDEFHKHQPKSFTVYPFRNTSWYQEGAERGRQAIHGKFSLIGPCAPLAEVDRRARQPYTAEDAMRVARELDTEALIIGETLVQDHVFLVLYAYAFVKLKIAIYDTRTGRLIWQGSSWSMKGDLAGLSPYTFFIPFGPILEHVYWSRITADLHNRVAMDIVHRLHPEVITP